jgi:hypothetical protein
MNFFSAKTRSDLQYHRRVQPFDASVRKAATPLERMILDLLDREGPKNFTEIVNRIAKQIYRDELCHGAAVIDIGLLGTKLFEAEVVAALNRGVGVWWLTEEIVSAKVGNSGSRGQERLSRTELPR